MTPEAIYYAQGILLFTMFIAVVGQAFCALFPADKWTKLAFIWVLELVIFLPYWSVFQHLCK